MTDTRIYVEGGGTSKALRISCQNGFSNLLKNCGYAGCLPRIVACGGRNQAHDRFKTASEEGIADFVALLIDSEDVLDRSITPWQHLETRQDNTLRRPSGATDEQVLFMATSMETWIASDAVALAKRFGDKFQTSALPPWQNIEARHRDYVYGKLVHATRNCKTKYIKDDHSFDLLGKLNYCILYDRLPSFKRMIEILDQRLGCTHTPCPGEDGYDR